MFSILTTTYISVLIAEAVGDRMVYTTIALCARFRTAYVLGGIAMACCGKTLAAVLFGDLITRLPQGLVVLVSAGIFFVTAFSVWHRRAGEQSSETASSAGGANVLVVSFAAVFFSEWADVGQLTTAAVAARFHAPMLVWIAATLALFTKALAAAAMGTRVRNWVPSAALRVTMASWFLILGTISLRSTFGAAQPLAARPAVQQHPPATHRSAPPPWPTG